MQEHKYIIPCLLGAHALSGCDTVATYVGIGKGTVVKNLKPAPNSLTVLGCLGAPLSDVVEQATRLGHGFYSMKLGVEKTMSHIRNKIWAAKFGVVGSPKELIQLNMDMPSMCYQSFLSLLQYQLEYHLHQMRSCH